ncbi:carboxylesterase family protein [Microbacterium aurum]
MLEGAPRNLGLADAAAGLRWVQREVAAFGGDPARITIVGESAGGALVAALLCWPDTAAIPRVSPDAECARSRRVRPLWGACRGRARRERARSARSRGEVARRGRGARTAVVLRR